MRLAIADPPYPPHYAERRDRPGGNIRVLTRSRARRHYGNGTRPTDERPADFHDRAGEWDSPARHRQLLEDLMADYDGWAIATTLDGLDHYRPLPIPARTMIWHKPTATPTSGRVASSCEAVIVYAPEGRRSRHPHGQIPDLLSAVAPQGFAGAKPERWTRWVLDALLYDPETDTVDDLFPGSGMVTNALAQGVLV
jgi:hypothetical protein